MWGSPSASVGPVGSGSSYVCHKVLCESATLLQWGVFYIRVKVRLAHFCVCVFVCLCVRACVCVYSVGASLEVPNLLIMINSCWMLVSCFTLECLADLIFGFFKKNIYIIIFENENSLSMSILGISLFDLSFLFFLSFFDLTPCIWHHWDVSRHISLALIDANFLFLFSLEKGGVCGWRVWFLPLISADNCWVEELAPMPTEFCNLPSQWAAAIGWRLSDSDAEGDLEGLCRFITRQQQLSVTVNTFLSFFTLPWYVTVQSCFVKEYLYYIYVRWTL